MTFAKVVRLLIELQWNQVLRSHRHVILQLPFSEWLAHMTALTKEVSELKVDGISLKETMAELAQKFGPITQKHGYEFVNGRTSKANMAIAQAKKRPNCVQEGIAQYAAVSFLDVKR